MTGTTQARTQSGGLCGTPTRTQATGRLSWAGAGPDWDVQEVLAAPLLTCFSPRKLKAMTSGQQQETPLVTSQHLLAWLHEARSVESQWSFARYCSSWRCSWRFRGVGFLYSPLRG